jgi:antitoxin FitA
MHNASMPNVLVRDLPEPVHQKLTERAAARGQSLQAYLKMELARLAQTESLEEVLARIEKDSGGRVRPQEALEAIHEARAER